jgi:ribonuclease HI
MTFLHFLTLIFQFDGSLRIPQDPHPQIVPTSITSSSVLPLASCSFALLKEDENDRTGHLLKLEGKALYGKQLSSADVEYEGLLLGLNEILLFPFFNQTSTSTYLSYNHNKIIIRGDCKTVIDQLNGISLPRKQRTYYNEAKALIQRIENENNVTFIYEHVKRDENQLCDYMCLKIIQLMQLKYVIDLKNTINEIVQAASLVNTNGEIEILSLSKKKRMRNKSTQFAQLIHSLSSHDSATHIPVSIRPYWLCQLFLRAECLKDYVAIRLIGEALISESKYWKKIGQNNILSDRMEVMGYKLVLHSLEHMELYKEADKIMKKIHNSAHVTMENNEGIGTCMEFLQKDLPSWNGSQNELLADISLPFYYSNCNAYIANWFESKQKQIIG